MAQQRHHPSSISNSPATAYCPRFPRRLNSLVELTS